MKKRWWWIFGGALLFLAVVICLVAVLLWWRAPEYLRIKLQTEVSENCKTCRLEIGAIDLDLGEFELRDIKFTSGVEGAFQTLVTCPSLRGHVDLRSLLRHHVIFHRVIAQDLIVRLTDGDVVPPGDTKKADDSTAEPSDWDIVLRKGIIENGRLVYTRNHKGTSATLDIHDVHASIDEVGNSATTRERISTMFAKFQIEKSGAVELRIAVPFLVKPLRIDTHLIVKDQRLSDLNPFFEPNAGVDLKGLLRFGEASSELRDKHVKSTVVVQYEDFDLELKSDYERSGFAAFWENLGANIVMSSNNLDRLKKDQTATVEADRKENESLVSFILQSFKKAAIKITRQ